MLRLAMCVVIGLTTVVLSGCEQHGPAPATTPPVAAPIAPPSELGAWVDMCNRCHSPQKDDTELSAPFIAGQQHDYLISAITRYATGERQHAEMNAITADFTDTQIAALARYYAGQPIVWSGIDLSTPELSPAPNLAAITTGKRLSKSCSACHGDHGVSQRPGVPNLAGLARAYLNSALREYVYGARISELMYVYQYSLEDRDIQALAAYYASLPPQQASTARNITPTPPPAAKGACDGCHGGDGNPLLPGIPRLAGQDQGYLISALSDYRANRRPHTDMRNATANLSRQDIKQLATYYANQHPREVTTGTIALNTTFNALDDGRQLAMSCDGCHDGETPGMPVLNGLHPDYLSAAMVSYQQQRRPHAAMTLFLSPYNALDIEKLSRYYATRPVAAKSSPNLPAPPDIETLSNACDACHGPLGNSTAPLVPSLAGQDAQYLEQAIGSYVVGERDHEAMANAVSPLTPQQRQQLVRHYASQQRVPLTVRIPQAPEQLTQRCNRCHGPDGASQQPDKPRLAGQLESYLLKALQDYQSRRRQHAIMFNMSKDLTPLELRAIAAHYAAR